MSLIRNLPYDHPYRWDGRLFGGQQLWRPSNLGSQLATWFDAEDTASITLNGATVSQWNDKSGNARHVAQATAANQPTYQASGIGGKPALSFDGADWLFNPTDSNIMQNVAGGSITVVANYTNIVTQRVAASVINNLNTSRAIVFLSSSGTLTAGGRRVDGDAASVAAAPTTYTYGTNVIQNVSMDFAGNLNSQFVNGSAAGTSTFPSGGGNSNNTVANTLVIGATSPDDGVSATNVMLGLISEVVITSGAPLSTADRERLEGYLAWKLGLEANLPSGHPFKNTPPTV